MIYLTRREVFSAAHRLYNPAWTDERNAETFGKCSNAAGHGHNYVLEVTLRGTPDPETGYVYDLNKLKLVIRKAILEKVDHRHLNVDVDFLRGVVPTSENLAAAFWKQLDKELPPGMLYSVKLHETENNYAEYKADNI